MALKNVDMMMKPNNGAIVGWRGPATDVFVRARVSATRFERRMAASSISLSPSRNKRPD